VLRKRKKGREASYRQVKKWTILAAKIGILQWRNRQRKKDKIFSKNYLQFSLVSVKMFADGI